MRVESVDANVLLRAALDLGDDQTALACELLTSTDRMFSVSSATMAECMHVLVRHYAMDRPDAAAVLRWVLGFESVVCQSDIVEPALDMFEAHPKLSFEDCLVAEQASASGATPLWTFDTKLAKQHPAAKLVA